MSYLDHSKRYIHSSSLRNTIIFRLDSTYLMYLSYCYILTSIYEEKNWTCIVISHPAGCLCFYISHSATTLNLQYFSWLFVRKDSPFKPMSSAQCNGLNCTEAQCRTCYSALHRVTVKVCPVHRWNLREHKTQYGPWTLGSPGYWVW